MVGAGVVELNPKNGDYLLCVHEGANEPCSRVKSASENLEYCWSRTLMNSPGGASGQVQHPWALGPFTNPIWYCEIFCELAPP